MQWKRKAWLKDHWSVPWFFQNLKCSHNIAYVHPGSSKLMRKPQKRCFFVSIRWQLSTPGKSAHRWILVQGSASAGWSAAADSDKDLALAWLLGNMQQLKGDESGLDQHGRGGVWIIYIWLRCLPLPCLVIQSALIPDQLAFKLPPMRSILINAIAWRMCKKILIKAHSDSEVRLDVLAGQLTNGHHGRHNSVARSAKVRASMLSIENK